MAQTHENQIAERSYQIWETEGKPHGRHWQHWFQAIAELEAASPRKSSSKAVRKTATPKKRKAAPKKA